MARMQYRCFDLTVFFVLILSLNVRHPGKTNTHLRKNAFAKNFIFHFDMSNTQTFHTLRVTLAWGRGYCKNREKPAFLWNNLPQERQRNNNQNNKQRFAVPV